MLNDPFQSNYFPQAINNLAMDLGHRASDRSRGKPGDADRDDPPAKVDELVRLQAETQKELDALMPSLLAKAFAREL